MKKSLIGFALLILAVFLLIAVVGCSKKPAEKALQPGLYHCPMHPSFIADKPGDCAICGMKLVPMEKKAAAPPARPAPTKKTLYRSSMNPGEISDKPGKDSMGMEMVPFTNETPAAGATGLPGLAAVAISPENRKRMNLKLATAEIKNLSRRLRTSARIVPDETRLFRVTAKIDGYIEKLFVNATGQAVRRGQPLLSIYSPDLVASQQEFLSALIMAKQMGQSPDPLTAESGRGMLDAARRRLKLWDISDAQIQRLEKSGRVEKVLTLAAPASGYVSEKMVLAGQKIMAGETLMVIADLAVVWAEADIYAADADFIKTGMDADLTLPFLPDRTFKGRIDFLNPFLDGMSRTLKARLEVANPDLLLKPEMYGEISLAYDLGERLVIPDAAVMRSGERSYVFVDDGAGSLTPVLVRTGIQSGDDLEILSGLKSGDRVVAAANFLVDSESSLKAALQAYTDKK
jgi:multidrug efflux pump subunit AcrA (membrane-fusion protein)